MGRRACYKHGVANKAAVGSLYFVKLSYIAAGWYATRISLECIPTECDYTNDRINFQTIESSFSRILPQHLNRLLHVHMFHLFIGRNQPCHWCNASGVTINKSIFPKHNNDA